MSDKRTNGQMVNGPSTPGDGIEDEGRTVQRSNGPLGERAIRGTNTNNNNNISTHMHACVCGASSLPQGAVRPLDHLLARPLDLLLWVPGHPVTQGSKRAFVAGGHARLVESGGDRHRLWRHAINDEARQRWVKAPLIGPIGVALVFAIQPPKTMTRAKRAAGPVGAHSGDIDKLTRAVLDALTGVVYLDDSQVTLLVAEKRWATDVGPGARIAIQEVR